MKPLPLLLASSSMLVPVIAEPAAMFGPMFRPQTDALFEQAEKPMYNLAKPDLRSRLDMSKSRQIKQNAFVGANRIYKQRQDQVGRHVHEVDMNSHGLTDHAMNIGFRRAEELRRAKAAKEIEAFRNPKTFMQKAHRRKDDVVKSAWHGWKNAGRPKADGKSPIEKAPKGTPAEMFKDGPKGLQHQDSGSGLKLHHQPAQNMGPRPQMFQDQGSGPGVQIHHQTKQDMGKRPERHGPSTQELQHQDSASEVKIQRQSKPKMERHDSAASVDFHTPSNSVSA